MQNNQYQELVDRLHFRIETLENNAAALEKDVKVKDGIIQNLNAGFNVKIDELKKEVEELKAANKDMMKKEKKSPQN